MTRIISIVGGMQPSAPTIGTATAGDTTASVAFTASSYIGKGTITYTATSSPGGFTATGASSPLTVTGLTNGTAYTFTVVGTTNYGVASVASAASNSITPATQSSYESIATVTVGGTSQSSISFTSIPSTFKHLQLRAISKTNRNDAGEYQTTLNMRFNSDSGSNYSYHRLIGNGSSISATGGGSVPYMYFYFGSSVTNPANTFGVGVYDILDYANTNKYKTVRVLSGVEDNTYGTINLGSGAWLNTNAVTSISLIIDSANDFTQYTQFALYGIKG